MRRVVFLIIGIVLVLVGVVWILQGFDLLGQSGGMNGHKIYALIGLVVGLIGAALIGVGARRGRRPVA
jgi:drug/metabolite transporter (DMT)-like permease